MPRLALYRWYTWTWTGATTARRLRRPSGASGRRFLPAAAPAAPAPALAPAAAAPAHDPDPDPPHVCCCSCCCSCFPCCSFRALQRRRRFHCDIKPQHAALKRRSTLSDLPTCHLFGAAGGSTTISTSRCRRPKRSCTPTRPIAPRYVPPKPLYSWVHSWVHKSPSPRRLGAAENTLSCRWTSAAARSTGRLTPCWPGCYSRMCGAGVPRIAFRAVFSEKLYQGS